MNAKVGSAGFEKILIFRFFFIGACSASESTSSASVCRAPRRPFIFTSAVSPLARSLAFLGRGSTSTSTSSLSDEIFRCRLPLGTLRWPASSSVSDSIGRALAFPLSFFEAFLEFRSLEGRPGAAGSVGVSLTSTSETGLNLLFGFLAAVRDDLGGSASLTSELVAFLL